MSKRYKVVGPRAVDGHQPGEEFVANWFEEHEQAMKDGGHIRVVDATPYSKNKKEGDKDA